MGKNVIRLDWEKAVYRPLFTLANTLINYEKFQVCSISAFSDIAVLIISDGTVTFSHTIYIDLPITLNPFLSHIF